MASPLEFSLLSSIISGVSAPGASVLGYGLPPYRIFYTVTYILLKSFCTRSFCPRVWPPPYRIFYTVVYNLFPGVSALGVSALGVSALGVSALGVSALGVSVFGSSLLIYYLATAVYLCYSCHSIPLLLLSKHRPEKIP